MHEGFEPRYCHNTNTCSHLLKHHPLPTFFSIDVLPVTWMMTCMVLCLFLVAIEALGADAFQLLMPLKGQDYEVVRLIRSPHPEFKVKAFGDEIRLNLEPNQNIISPSFEAFVNDGDVRTPIPSSSNTSCNYLHSDESSTAAFDFCDPDSVRGLVLTDKFVLEIEPVEEDHSEDGYYHLVKRRPLVPDDWTEHLRNVPAAIERQISSALSERALKKRKSASGRPMVELGLFFDEAAYKLFSPFFKNDDVKLKNMLLAYINGVQALYHHPSAGTKIDLMLTHLEIFKTQPSDLPHYAGERSNLLDSFCVYNEKHNPADDKDPKHWDMGLYVSGLDFYAVENGKKSGVTMGLATVGGVCQAKYACVIAEFGVTNILGKPYPSAGFTSVYVLAHEMGHNLGMHHDSSSNSCPKDGFIMSPSRGVNGETLWSHCSADVLKGLDGWAKCLYDIQKPNTDMDHTKFKDKPGAVWGPKKQCEILLRDPDANYVGDDKKEVPEICQSLPCRTPHRTGYYYAGPALEGSACGVGKTCQGGSCTAIKGGDVSEVVAGGWGSWKYSKCQSGCTSHSKGFQKKQRQCNNPSPVYSIDGCKGPSYGVSLCRDEKICKYKKRVTAAEFASRKCYEFNRYLSTLDKYGAGLQAPHEQGRLWVSCAIFCRREDSGLFYSPRIELNDIGLDPYFPDGTWCHNDGVSDFYCMQHHCLPENFQLTKDSIWITDLLMSQNALPHPLKLPDDLQNYLSLDAHGKPISTTYEDNHFLKPPSEDEWATVDYLEIKN